MDRALALLVVVLSCSPSLSRRLPDAVDLEHAAEQHHAAHDTTAAAVNRTGAPPSLEGADEATDSFQRYALLPTPNVASSILSSLFLPDGRQPEPGLAPATPSVSARIVPRHRGDWPRQEHHRKIKIRDDGTLWTKMPNVKHLVEIVPIEHKSKTKGKALAYIVPKSHSVKKKLKKRKIISGIAVNNMMPDLSEETDSSEENPKIYSSESKSSGSESDSEESDSSDRQDKTTKVNHDDLEVVKTPKRKIVLVDEENSNAEDKTNNKLNGIVSYFKEHKDANLNSLLHKAMPEDETDAGYHVHYIIHKKHQPNNKHKLSEDDFHSTGDNVIHIKHNRKENDDNYKELHSYPPIAALNKHEIKNEHERHHHVPNDNISSGEKLVQFPHKIIEHDVNSHNLYNAVHSNHELPPEADNTELTHDEDKVSHLPPSSGDLEYITSTGKDKVIKDIPVESIERLYDSMHEGVIDPDLNQLYEILAEIEKNSQETLTNEAKPQTHQMHIDPDSNGHDSDRSESENNSDELSGETYSEEDESHSANASHSKEESIESDVSNISSASEDSEDVSYHVDSPEVNQSYSDPTFNTEDLSQAQTLESSSSDTVDESPSLEQDKSSELGLDDVTSHIFPNCLQLKKKKFTSKCDNKCEGHKSYTLTFLFNR